jgi:hypothetical protein
MWWGFTASPLTPHGEGPTASSCTVLYCTAQDPFGLSGSLVCLWTGPFSTFPDRGIVRGGDLSHRQRESRSEAACGPWNLMAFSGAISMRSELGSLQTLVKIYVSPFTMPAARFACSLPGKEAWLWNDLKIRYSLMNSFHLLSTSMIMPRPLNKIKNPPARVSQLPSR